MQVLHQLPVVKDKDLLVGVETADDAGVYKISDELAIISTLDFFPPIVDDPFTFGQIAAANALSDVYAMGGTPRLALNIVGFPKELDLGILNEIIRGGLDKMSEAGVLLVGGHSVEDHEIKYGLAVTGFVHPEGIVTNRGARPGDVLVLTKPIGVGVIASAVRAGTMRAEEAEEVFSSMTTLNKAASEAMKETGVNACTDITGYGLMGHAMEMARASGACLVIRSGEVRTFPRAKEFISKRSLRPRTIGPNMDFLKDDVSCSPGVDEGTRMLLFDPQTSGGLLISVPRESADALLGALMERGVKDAHVVGEVVEKREGPSIRVE